LPVGISITLPQQVFVSRLSFVSVSEIIEELPRLDSAERQRILDRILDLENPQTDEERAEELAAIDEGIRSLQSGPGIPLDELRQRLAKWTTPSS
jgi:hypothetical protein